MCKMMICVSKVLDRDFFFAFFFLVERVVSCLVIYPMSGGDIKCLIEK